MNNIIKLRLFLWAILAATVAWLIYAAVVPGGRIVYSYDFTSPSYFIRPLTPAERVKPLEVGSQAVIGDPVYFSLRTPRRFDQAKLTVKYRRLDEEPAGPPVIEAGLLVDKTIWRHDLKPLENTIIDQLALVWPVIREGESILLQRQKKYASISEFLDQPPPRSELALYNYNLNQPMILPDYWPAEQEKIVDLSLRGAYQFYTYLKNEKLDFSFWFEDLNSNRDVDPIDINLYYNGGLIDSRHLDDDGISDDQRGLSDRGRLDLKLADLPEGVYKIEVRVNDDIVTKTISASQQKLAFINKLRLADRGRSGLTLFTDSRQLQAQTINPGRLQTIQAGESELVINQTYKQFSADLKASTTRILLPLDDVIISGDGVFSLAENGLINPGFKKVDANLDINGQGVNYILAAYQPPVKQEGWTTATVEFNLTGAYREDIQYSFLLSLPGLKAEDEVDDGIEISEIKMELNGKTLWQKLRGMINKRQIISNF